MAGVPPVPPGLTQEEKTWAMLAHLFGLLGYLVGLGQIIAPLVVYLVYKDKSRFVAYHALQSLYFQLMLILLWVVAIILIVVTCGIGAFIVVPAGVVVHVLALVLVIVAAIKASGGEVYEYWLVGRWARDQVGI
jgi:hypothetical protein